MFYKKQLIGEDEFGNKYYQGDTKRCVVYKDRYCDPTSISVDWHLWLHYAVDSVEAEVRSSWQVNRSVNATGTPDAHNPRSEKGALHYVPWQPE